MNVLKKGIIGLVAFFSAAGQRTNSSQVETSGALTGHAGFPGIGNSSNSDFLYSSNPAALTPTGRNLLSHSLFSGAADSLPHATDLMAVMSGTASKQQLDSALSTVQQVAEAGKAEATNPESRALVTTTSKSRIQLNGQIMAGFEAAANQFISHIPQSYQRRFAQAFTTIGSVLTSASKAGVDLSRLLGITVSKGGQLMIGDGSPQPQSQVPGSGGMTTADQAAELRAFDAARSTTDASALVTRAPAPQSQSPLPGTSPVRGTAQPQSPTPTYGPNLARTVTPGGAASLLEAATLAAAAAAVGAANLQGKSRRSDDVGIDSAEESKAPEAADAAAPAPSSDLTAEQIDMIHNLATETAAKLGLDGRTRASATHAPNPAEDAAATLDSVSVISARTADTLDSITVAGTNPATTAAKAPTKTRKPLLSPDDTFAAYKIQGGFDKKVKELAKLRSELPQLSDEGARAKKQLEVTKAENMLRKGKETGGQYREHAANAGEAVPPKQTKQSTGTPSEPSPYETWLCKQAQEKYDFDNTPKAGSADPKKTFDALSEDEQRKYTKQYVYDNRSAKLGDYHRSLSSAGNIQGTPDGSRGKSFATSEGSKVKFSVNLDGTLKTEVEGNLNAVVSVKRKDDNGQLTDYCDMIEFKDGKMVGFHLNTDAPGTKSQLNVGQLEELKMALDARAPTPAVPAAEVAAASAAAPASPQSAAAPAASSAAPAPAPVLVDRTAAPDGSSVLAAAAHASQPHAAAETHRSAARQQPTGVGAPRTNTATHATPSAESIISGTSHRASAAAGQRPPAADAGAPAAATARQQSDTHTHVPDGSAAAPEPRTVVDVPASSSVPLRSALKGGRAAATTLAAGAPTRPQTADAARAATKMVAKSVGSASTTTPPGLQASTTPHDARSPSVRVRGG